MPKKNSATPHISKVFSAEKGRAEGRALFGYFVSAYISSRYVLDVLASEARGCAFESHRGYWINFCLNS